MDLEVLGSNIFDKEFEEKLKLFFTFIGPRRSGRSHIMARLIVDVGVNNIGSNISIMDHSLLDDFRIRGSHNVINIIHNYLVDLRDNYSIDIRMDLCRDSNRVKFQFSDTKSAVRYHNLFTFKSKKEKKFNNRKFFMLC